MLIKKMSAAVAAAALMTAALPASAEVIILTFEGIQNNAAVGNFYAGGGGTNYGITFGPAASALIDSEAGGNGNFANEPSESTVMYFSEGKSVVMNKSSGFSDGFSFYYSSAREVVAFVYDGVNASGNMLGYVHLFAQRGDNNCVGDPGGDFCNWTGAGVSFAGTARSIDFRGTAGYIILDNIALGSAIPVVPEASTFAMLLAGLGLLGFVHRRLEQRG